MLDEDPEWTFEPLRKEKIPHIADGFALAVLSPRECKKLIALTEAFGYEHCGDLEWRRNNTRMLTDDRGLAARLFDRVKAALPATYAHDGKVWQLCGLNQRFRFCRYGKGQKFGIHIDVELLVFDCLQLQLTVLTGVSGRVCRQKVAVHVQCVSE